MLMQHFAGEAVGRYKWLFLIVLGCVVAGGCVIIHEMIFSCRIFGHLFVYLYRSASSGELNRCIRMKH